MDALRTAVGKEAAALLRVAYMNRRHYVVVSDMSAFRSANSVADKLGGLIADRDRVATIGFVAPGTKIGESTLGPGGSAATPGVTRGNDVSITRGPLGVLPAALSETFKDVPGGLPEILLTSSHTWMRRGTIRDLIASPPPLDSRMRFAVAWGFRLERDMTRGATFGAGPEVDSPCSRCRIA